MLNAKNKRIVHISEKSLLLEIFRNVFQTYDFCYIAMYKDKNIIQETCYAWSGQGLYNINMFILIINCFIISHTFYLSYLTFQTENIFP